MPWFKIDDAFHSHPKTMAAGTAAVGLWVRCGSWVAQQLTDGFVPASIAALYGTRGQAAALVRAGLWDQVEGGYRFHDWHDQNPTAEKVRGERASAAERQRRAREAAASRRDSLATAGERHAVTHTSVTPLVTVPPSRPVPVPSSSVVGRSSPVTGRARENRDLDIAAASLDACRRLRPDWNLLGIRRAFRDATTKGGSEHRASIALQRVAASRDSDTPRRVLADGWWWDDTDHRATAADATVAHRLEEPA